MIVSQSKLEVPSASMFLYFGRSIENITDSKGTVFIPDFLVIPKLTRFSKLPKVCTHTVNLLWSSGDRIIKCVFFFVTFYSLARGRTLGWDRHIVLSFCHQREVHAQ